MTSMSDISYGQGFLGQQSRHIDTKSLSVQRLTLNSVKEVISRARNAGKLYRSAGNNSSIVMNNTTVVQRKSSTLHILPLQSVGENSYRRCKSMILFTRQASASRLAQRVTDQHRIFRNTTKAGIIPKSIKPIMS
ncbi:hypothetical protein QQG55_44455 [Brugia pahangi]|uniref:Kinesin motor domain-containing protein n=1 Tax=Brugia pahangi TaxID=6280 RepID=A0A0N4TSE7_BRUPA|nr:unnamed protein product [Brugia pahangi]